MSHAFTTLLFLKTPLPQQRNRPFVSSHGLFKPRSFTPTPVRPSCPRINLQSETALTLPSHRFNKAELSQVRQYKAPLASLPPTQPLWRPYPPPLYHIPTSHRTLLKHLVSNTVSLKGRRAVSRHTTSGCISSTWTPKTG